MVHAEYYFDPYDLADLLRRTSGYAVSVRHDFPDAAGTLCDGTLRYHIGLDGQLVAVANGESTVYHHDPGWWHVSTLVPVSPYYHLRWYEHARFGDTAVVVWELMEGASPLVPDVPDLPFSAASQEPGLSRCSQLDTALNRDVVNPRFDVHSIPFTGVFCIAGMFVFPTGNRTIVPVPRGLVGNLRTLALAQRRTPALYLTLVARAKRVLGQLNVPDDIAALAAPVAAAAALATVEHETAALGRVVALHQRVFDLHARVLDFVPLRTVPNWALPVSTLAVPALALAAHPVAAVGLASAAAVGSVWGLWTNSHMWSEAQEWRNRRLYGAATHVSRNLYFDGPQTYPGLFKPKTPPDAPIAGRIQVLRSPPAKVDTAEERHVLGHVGLAFSTITPSAIARTEDAALNAIRSRLLATYPLPKPGTWEVMHGRIRNPNRPISQLVCRPGPMPDGQYHQWASRFNASTRQVLDEARMSLFERPFCRDDARLSLIVKSEKTGWLDLDELTKNDARAVLSPTPRFNAFAGPWLNWISKAMIDARTLAPDSDIAWAVSTTAETLGAWLDYKVAFYSRPGHPAVIYIIDHARMDGHERDESHDWSIDLFELNADPADLEEARAVLDAWTQMAKPQGKVQGLPHIRFKGAEKKQISGGPATTSRNCANSEAALDYTFGPPGPESYSAIITGDDNLVVGFDFALPAVALVLPRAAELGFEFTATRTTDLTQVEFCSLIPYPSDVGTVFGPKIGRNLARGGWTVSPEKSDPHGMAVSIEASVSHIPFLRQFFELHRRLCAPVGLYVDRRINATEAHHSTPATYEFIATRYGLTPDDEAAFAALLDTVTSLPATIEWPRINEVARRDD